MIDGYRQDGHTLTITEDELFAQENRVALRLANQHSSNWPIVAGSFAN